MLPTFGSLLGLKYLTNIVCLARIGIFGTSASPDSRIHQVDFCKDLQNPHLSQSAKFRELYQKNCICRQSGDLNT